MPRRNSRRRNTNNNNNRAASSLPDNRGLQISRVNNNYPYQPMLTPILRPTMTITRRVETTFDIVCDGINPSLGIFAFNLTQLPNSTELTNLFQTYRIDSVSLVWRPEYTELTDAAPVSNAVNVGFHTAVSVDNAAPVTVSSLLECSNCSTTSVTREHRVKLHPQVLMSNIMPCSCAISTLSAGTFWYGVKYGIDPTGVTMRFRSTAVYKITLMGAK